MLKKVSALFLFLCFSFLAFSQVNTNVNSIISGFSPVPDSLKSFIDSSLKVCNNKPDSIKAKCLIDEGFKYNGINYLKAVNLAQKGFLQAQKSGNSPQMGRAMMLLGYANFWIGNYDKALSYYSSALKIFQQINDLPGQALALKETGILYSKNGRKKDAKDYYIASMNIYQKLNDEGGVADLNSEIGGGYEYEGNLEEALKYYYKSYFLYKKLNSDLGCSYSADFIAQVYSQWGKYDSALYYEQKSLDWRVKLNDKHEVSIAQNNMGEIFFAKKEYKTAMDFFKKSIVLSKEIGFVDLQQYSYDNMAKCYVQLGDYKNAFLFQNLHTKLKDSIFNESRSKQLIEYQTKYETEKKDNQIRNLETQSAINKLKVEEEALKVEKRNYMLIALVLLLLSLSAGTYFWYSRIKLKNQLAKEKAIKETEEHERMRIAKDIHDDLGSGLSKINFLSEIIYSKSSQLPEIRHSSESVKETAKKMIENMCDLIWALNPDNTTLPNLVARMREYITDYLEDLPIEVQYILPNPISDYPINKEFHRELFMIVKECMNNISKHSKASKVVFIVNITDTLFTIAIMDNGIGFDEETVKKGNGLRNMNSRITAIGGTFSLISGNEKGTSVTVAVPLQKLIKS